MVRYAPLHAPYDYFENLVSGMRQLAGTTKRGTGGLTPLRSPESFPAGIISGRAEYKIASMSDGRPSEWLNDLRSGDADSARRIFEHFSQRLCRVAQRHLSARVRPRVDEEDVVQSVFRTFFQRDAQGQFQVNHSDELYRLLEPIKERLLKRDSTLAGASNKDDASSNDGPLSGSDLS